MTAPACDLCAAAVLDARSAAELSAEMRAHVTACVECAALANTHFAMFARMAATPIAPPAAAWAAIAARVAAGPASAQRPAGADSSPAPGFFDRVLAGLRALGAPGLVTAGVCAVMFFATSGRSGGLAYRAGGKLTSAGVTLAAAGQLSPGAAPLALAEDAWVEITQAAGSTVRVEGPAAFKLAARGRVELTRGRSRFDLGPQPDGFVVTIPGGDVRVIGTKFTVDAGAEVTQVAVEHGVVEVHPAAGAALRLSAGEHAELGSEGVLRPATTAGTTGTAVPTASAPAGHAPVHDPAPRPSVAGADRIPDPASVPMPSIRPVRPGRRATGGF